MAETPENFIGRKVDNIHLLVRSETETPIKTASLERETLGEERFFFVACTPESTLPRVATGECVAVTCEKCKATEHFKRLEIEQANAGVALADQKQPEKVEPPKKIEPPKKTAETKETK